MKWHPDAEAAIAKVPFFVRRKVRLRVEQEAVRTGKAAVSLADVMATRKRYISGMSAEIKGYQLDACFGPSGCPNRALEADHLVARLEKMLQDADLLGFLKAQVGDNLKFHHEFRVSVAECPNACSQPQIKDVGIIAARTPRMTDTACSGCRACVDICPDGAIALGEDILKPVIDKTRCMSCGKCIEVCPDQVIQEGQKGYKVLLAGKLGRHPRLARPLPGLFDEDQVLDIVGACLDFYKANSRGGRRFAEVFGESDIALPDWLGQLSFGKRTQKISPTMDNGQDV